MPRERIHDADEAAQRVLFGPMDRHLRALRERYGVRVSARQGTLTVDGDDAGAVEEVARRVRDVMQRIRPGFEPPTEEVEELLLGPSSQKATGARPARPGSRARAAGRSASPPRPTTSAPLPRPTRSGPPVPGTPRPRTPGQEVYVRAMEEHDVVFAVGPAGTGKTFLAVVQAVEALRSGLTHKIVLTRPAVEAGEKLGFLPGDFHAKINPYLRPLYDALGDLLTYGEVQRLLATDVIEIVPLAYMRGRTLKQAFIILDEAQNTTPAQMKMFLTRMGEGSRIVVTGDVTQVDLPDGSPSGLVEAVRILEGVRGLSVVRFSPRDILRHPLVQRIVDAYEVEGERRAAEGPPPPRRGS
ncbi:MAG: PhoH family protein [Planctomycetota bacterium]